MKKFFLAALLFVSGVAQAANFPILAGASIATQNSTIATAAAASGGNTVTYAAGSYATNGVVTVPCPASPLVIQGPVTTYRAPVSLLPASYSYSTPYTANLNSSVTGSSAWFVSSSGCSQLITIQGFNWNGGQPSGGGGGWITIPAGGSNVLIQNNYIHGNWASTTTGHSYDDFIYLAGTGTQTPIDSNIQVRNNIFGDGTSDCNPIMNLTTYQGGQYSSSGGQCGGVGVQVSTTNLVVQNNDFEHLEQPLKFFESPGQGGQITQSFMANNVLIDSNDFGQWHRIAIEAQQDVVQNNTTGSVFNVTNNSFHDSIFPSNGLFAVSVPQCCGNFRGYTGTGATDNRTNVNNNVLISNNIAVNNWTAYANEFWSTGDTLNNLIQGYWSYLASGHVNGAGGATGWGDTSSATRLWSVSNNICQFPDVTGVCVAREIEHTNIPPTQTGNTTSATISARASAAPTISPSLGQQTFPLTVTLTDPGYTSGAGPQGNTGIWYTTDGSTPVPGAGTAQRLNSGGTFSLAAPGTVKAVGMWGAVNQPTAYPTNYGFVPSQLVSATYSSGGTPTIISGYLSTSPTDGVNTATVGGTIQFVPIANFSNGANNQPISPTACTWDTSNHAIGTVGAATGLFTAVAAIGSGAVNVTATCSTITFSYWTVTVSAPVGPTLTGLAASPSTVYSTTNTSLSAVGTFADGSVSTTTGTWISSNPTVAQVDQNGNVTPLGMGTSYITVTNGSLSASSAMIVPPSVLYDNPIQARSFPYSNSNFGCFVFQKLPTGSYALVVNADGSFTVTPQ